MNRHAAVQYMHDRHPRVIEAPDGEIDLEALNLDIFWLQAHVCTLLDRRAEREVRKCFETIHDLLIRGEPDVRFAVCHNFAIPHLIFHTDLAWAKERMPPLLAEFVDETLTALARSQRPDGGPGHEV